MTLPRSAHGDVRADADMTDQRQPSDVGSSATFNPERRFPRLGDSLPCPTPEEEAALAQAASEQRNRQVNLETAETLHGLAFAINGMADAMVEDDGILGALSGQGIANHLASLPRHVREVFAEHLTDEAAAALVAEQRYHEEVGRVAAEDRAASVHLYGEERVADMEREASK